MTTGGAANRSAREKQHFDELAVSHGDTWWGHRTAAGRVRDRRRAQLLAAWLEPRPGERLLEIGTGAGNFTSFFYEFLNGATLIAADISAGQLKVAGQRLSAAGYEPRLLVATDLQRPALRPGSFDGILGSSILHHLDLEVALAALRRLLTPGGRIVFAEPNLVNPWVFLERRLPRIRARLQDSPDESAYSRWHLRRLLEDRGFDRVEIRPIDYLHPLVPRPFIGMVSRVGVVLEGMPLVREFAGSLLIRARVGV